MGVLDVVSARSEGGAGSACTWRIPAALGRAVPLLLVCSTLKSAAPNRRPQPPQTNRRQVVETVHHLLEIINAYETAMESRPHPGGASASGAAAASASSAAGGPEELGPVLAAVLDPLAEMCERSAEALTPDAPSRVDEVARLDPTAHRVYLINCLAAVWQVLQHRAAASARSRQVRWGLQS